MFYTVYLYTALWVTSMLFCH